LILANEVDKLVVLHGFLFLRLLLFILAQYDVGNSLISWISTFDNAFVIFAYLFFLRQNHSSIELTET